MNSCLYYDVFDESYARLNAIIETMNDQHRGFVIEMMEFSLLHETDPNLPSSRLEANLYDNCESFLLLESNLVDDAPLASLASLPIVAPSFSSTPIDTTISDLILLASALPLTHSTGFEMGGLSRDGVSVI